MYRMWKDCKYFILAFVACVAMILTLAANEIGGTYEVVGDPYTASYTYCGAWTGAGGQHHCSLWLSGTERRVNTKVHGWFFETTGYKVVDR